MGSKGGRPTRFNAERALAVVNAIGTCKTRAEACAAADVPPATFYDWLRAGRRGTDPALRQFAAAVDRATKAARQARAMEMIARRGLGRPARRARRPG